MQNNDDIQTSMLRYGLDLGFLLSGFFGALLLSIRNKKKSISKSIACVFAGTISANYLTPLILEFAPESIQKNGKYAVAFMMGYIGLKGLEMIVDIFLDRVKSKKIKDQS
jgi:hypothetical protein